MGTSVSLLQSALRVEPGKSVSTELRVRNTGTVVDQFNFQPLGDATRWIVVDPPTVRLFPDSDAVVTVTLAPPRDSTSRAGTTSWAVKAVPVEDPMGAAVAEGTIEVGSFFELSAELQPSTGRGRLGGRFDMAIDNRGNTTVPVRVTGTDSEQALAFTIDPQQLECQPGSAHFAKIRIPVPKRIWRGQPKNHQFQLVVEPQLRTAVPEGGFPAPSATAATTPAPPVQPIVVNGNLLQEPIIPKWFVKALLALLGLLLVLFVLWKVLLKPSVESAAREEAVKQIAPVASVVDSLKPAVQEATAKADQAATDAAAAGGAGQDSSSGNGLGNVLNATSTPTNFRLQVSTSAGATNSVAGTTNPPNQSFALTDWVLQNPGGDIGRIRILINGEPIIESALENFRDLDFHFVAPYVVLPGQAITVEVTCSADQIVAADPCDNAVSFSGFTTTITSTPTTTQQAGG